MNTGGCWLFGRPDEIFIRDDVLYRRIYETDQVYHEVYHDERVMTKKEFLLCIEEWYNNKEKD